MVPYQPFVQTSAILYRILILHRTVCTMLNPGGRAVLDVPSLDCLDCGCESCCGHGCSSVVFVV
jgi:hypothetical protein